MDILFIGGTGFFGKAFLNYLKSNRINSINSITIVGRSAEAFLESNIEFLDIKNVKDEFELNLNENGIHQLPDNFKNN